MLEINWHLFCPLFIFLAIFLLFFYSKFHTYNSLSLSSHCLIIGFASLKYNQSSCEFDTWTSILIFSTCNKIGTLTNLLITTLIFGSMFDYLIVGFSTLNGIKTKLKCRMNHQFFPMIHLHLNSLHIFCWYFSAMWWMS